MLRLNIAFEQKTWFFPMLEKIGKLEVLVITLAMLTIYKARCKDRQPNIEHFLRILRAEAEKEIGLARRNSQLVS